VSTLVVYGDASDGYIHSADGWDYDGTYSAALNWTGNTLYSDWTGPKLSVQNAFNTDYNNEYIIRESFLSFDTSALTSGATVSAAVLRLTAYDHPGSVFTIGASLGGGWRTSYSGALGTYNSASGWATGTGYDFSDVAMAANINKTGSTQITLTPSDLGIVASEWHELSAYSADTAGTTSDPKLTITYTAGAAEVYDGPGPTLDAIFRKTAAAAFTASAILKGSGSGSFAASAALKASRSGDLSSDSILRKTQSGSFTADATFVVGISERTGSFSASATVLVANTGSLTAESIIGRVSSGSLTASTVVLSPRSSSFSAAATIKATSSGSTQTDAIKLRTFWFGSVEAGF
jgi:hypothetical protein